MVGIGRARKCGCSGRHRIERFRYLHGGNAEEAPRLRRTRTAAALWNGSGNIGCHYIPAIACGRLYHRLLHPCRRRNAERAHDLEARATQPQRAVCGFPSRPATPSDEAESPSVADSRLIEGDDQLTLVVCDRKWMDDKEVFVARAAAFYPCKNRREATKMAGLFFEQCSVGQTFVHEIRRTVTYMDNIVISSLTYNPAAIDIDHEYAKGTEFG